MLPHEGQSEALLRYSWFWFNYLTRVFYRLKALHYVCWSIYMHFCSTYLHYMYVMYYTCMQPSRPQSTCKWIQLIKVWNDFNMLQRIFTFAYSGRKEYEKYILTIVCSTIIQGRQPQTEAMALQTNLIFAVRKSSVLGYTGYNICVVCSSISAFWRNLSVFSSIVMISMTGQTHRVRLDQIDREFNTHFE